VNDIFISYASADRSRVKPLVDELKRRGWSVWWDPAILPGEAWDDVIEAALTKARCVIVLWSRDSIQSQWVRTEADDARQRGILVPALLDDVVIPLAFRQIQAANLVERLGVFPSVEFDKLAQAVTKILSRDVPPAPETIAPATLPPPVQRPDPVPFKATRRHVWSFGSRRTMAAIGATLFVSAAGLAWYFASSRREPSRSPGIESAPSHVREDPKAEPAALPAPASSIPAAVVAPAERSNEPRRASAPVSPGPEAAVASRQPRNNAKDGLAYVWIPPGTFTMGCSPGDSECDADEKPAHKVTISTGFWMGQTPVTQEAYQRVVGTNPSNFKGTQLPVEKVDWNEAQSYCHAVEMRLPTEAEWEYAARAGSTASRYGDINQIAWYNDNSGRKTHDVAQKQPNAWGLYDMLGNVWQWTADWYADKYSGNSETDPQGPTSSQFGWRTLRGGSSANAPRNARASGRSSYGPGARGGNVGLRCVGN
jgi:formylglycine-generating enzyme required for sulfatase activity